MKIKTKINIVVMLSFCAVFIVSGVIYLSSKRADKESAEAKRADALARAIAEFNIFVFEHSIRHEERPLMQARLKYDSIAGLLKKEEFEFPEEQEILDKINLNYIITGSNLLQIIDLHKKQKPGKEEIVQIQEIEKSLENSILLRSQEMVSDAFRLAAMIRTGEERVHGMIHKLIILFVAILTVGFIAISILLSRSVTNPIIKLHKGTEIIGSGKLNYKVSTHTKDEIGQLSRAFDSMTDNLVKVMASRDELNREVDERKKVEVELFKSKEALELLNNVDVLPQNLLVSSDVEYSIKQVVDKVCEFFDYNNVSWETDKPNGQLHRTSDLRNLRTILPDFSFTSFDESLKKSIDWFIEHYPNCRI